MSLFPASQWTAMGLACLVGSAGCSLWPFADKDNTSYATPAKRVAAAQQIGAQAAGSDPARQEQLTLDLAGKIQTEPDPLVREAILQASSQFKTPMADRIQLAALHDTDPYVRQTACRLIGRRGDDASLAELGRVARNDADMDVRLAATRAIGEFRSPAAIPILSGGLHDRDPAIQLATVESLKLASGQDLGNDVGTWRDWIATRPGGQPSTPAIAGRAPPAPVGF